MKKLLLLFVGGWVGLAWGSSNPFELEPNIQHLEHDAQSLIEDLKKEAPSDEELDDLDEEANASEAQNISSEASESSDTEPSGMVSEKNDTAKVPSTTEEIKTPQVTNVSHPDEPDQAKEDEKAKVKEDNTIKKNETIEPSQEAPAPKHTTTQTGKQTAQQEVVSIDSLTEKSRLESKKSDSHAEQSVSEHANVGGDADTKEESREKKAPQKDFSLESLVSPDGKVADIDLEKERKKAELQAEEELRKAIAAVDQED